MLITENLRGKKVWRNIRSCINHNQEIAIDILLLDFPWGFLNINVYVCFSMNVYVFRYIFYIMNLIDKHRLILFLLKYIYIYVEYSLTNLTPPNNINIITHHVWLIHVSHLHEMLYPSLERFLSGFMFDICSWVAKDECLLILKFAVLLIWC